MWTVLFLGSCISGLVVGDESAHKLHASSLQAPPPPGQYAQQQQAASDVDPYYTDYYQASQPGTGSSGFGGITDRQAFEVLGAPVVLTAFAAALFGGILSPLVSTGFEAMSEYEIQWPEFKRKTETSSYSRNMADGEGRANRFSWINTIEMIGETLESINQINKESSDPSKKSSLGKFLMERAEQVISQASRNLEQNNSE